MAGCLTCSCASISSIVSYKMTVVPGCRTRCGRRVGLYLLPVKSQSDADDEKHFEPYRTTQRTSACLGLRLAAFRNFHLQLLLERYSRSLSLFFAFVLFASDLRQKLVMRGKGGGGREWTWLVLASVSFSVPYVPTKACFSSFLTSEIRLQVCAWGLLARPKS